jgi:hypothetical protein
MQNRYVSMAAVFLMVIGCLVFLTQCELFLGSDENANIGIDLSQLYEGSGRAITNIPPDITISGVRVSVFGPDMQPMQKSIAIGTRFVNMYVPAGQDRHFTLEVFFTQNRNFLYDHLRSYKGRAIADLRPGMFVGLKFQMVAGATALLVPDFTRGLIFQSDSLDFSSPAQGNLGGTITPNDLDIAANGRIFASNSANIYFANTISGGNAASVTIANPTAIAMDRVCYIDINGNDRGVIETSLLYMASGSLIYYSILENDQLGTLPTPSSPQPLGALGLGTLTITGMSVDPWTHHIFLVGEAAGRPPVQLLVEYDPYYNSGGGNPIQGRVVTYKTNADFSFLISPQDVIVKDDGIFVLNQVGNADTQLPIVLKFDRSLNYIGGFGTISSDGSALRPSTAAGKFYHPKRFFAQENDGLYIIDDSSLSLSNQDCDKLVFINTTLDSASWRTFPTVQPDQSGGPGESFTFFEP